MSFLFFIMGTSLHYCENKAIYIKSFNFFNVKYFENSCVHDLVIMTWHSSSWVFSCSVDCLTEQSSIGQILRKKAIVCGYLNLSLRGPKTYKIRLWSLERGVHFCYSASITMFWNCIFFVLKLNYHNSLCSFVFFCFSNLPVTLCLSSHRSFYTHMHKQLLYWVEQNVVICQWRADIHWLRQIIDLRDSDKSRYFAQPSSIIVLSFDHWIFVWEALTFKR